MRLRLTALAVLAAVAFTGTIASGVLSDAQANTQEQVEAEYTGDVIVKFKPSTSVEEIETAIEAAEAAPIASTSPSGLVLLEPDAGQSVDDAVEQLQSNPDVLFAEPDTLMRIVATPTDPHYASYQWHLTQIGLPAAWDTSTGNTNVIIAVIDTGMQSTHPDLTGKVTTGGNAGYNFVSNNTDTNDDHSHGTFVAGIIAANTNNGTGGAGVCWSCKIMPVKVLDNTGSGSSFNVAQGIDWAVSHGADVVNLSLGGGAASSLETAVNNAWNAGVIVVAATGNDNGPVLYPAAYGNAIAVGSNEQNGTRSSFSNFGPEIDIMAPGGSVLGTLCTCNGNPGGYGTGSGTSFAAPHVAGVVGLLIASGITDKDQIRSRLLTTATNMEGAGFDNNTGWGRVNTALAIAPGASTATPTPTATRTNTPTATRTNTPTATRTNTPVPPTATRTNTSTATRTNTPVPPTATHTNSPTATRTNTPVPPTSTPTNTPTNTATATPTQPALAVSWTGGDAPDTMVSGDSYFIPLSFQNTGTMTWNTGGANPVRLAYHWKNGTCPGTSNAVWNGNRTFLPANVGPGGTVSNLDAAVLAPAGSGTFCLQFDLIQEGVTWFSWAGAAVHQETITVTPGEYRVTWGAHNTPSTMVRGATIPVTISFTNSGTMTWDALPSNHVTVSYHWRTGPCTGRSNAVWTGLRTTLPADVLQGGAVSGLSVSVRAPSGAGTYCLQYDLLHEGITWFSWRGAAMRQVTVSIVNP